MQDIKFSVLIISHNQEKYIKETVESVLKQGYQNFEVVISDDCSTDKTQDVVKAIEDERVKLVTTPFNVGINGNEETGIRACTGDYIVLLGGDDRLRSEHLQRVYETIKEKNADVVYVHLCPINEHGHYKHGKDYDFWGYQDRTREEFLHDYFMLGNQVLSPGMTVKRESLMALLPLNLSLIPSQDYKEHVELLLNNNSVAVINEILVDYRQFRDSRNISTDLDGVITKRVSLETDILMDSFLNVSDLNLLKRVFVKEIEESGIKPFEDSIQFFLGYMAILSKNDDRQIWGYKQISKYISTFEGFIKAKEHYNFTFKEFCNLVNKVDCKQITKFNKKAKKYKKLFITTLISSSILILILLTILVIRVLG